MVAGRTRALILEVFTIPEAADSLGRSLPNFRRWLANDMLPAPIITDTSRNLACYSVLELEIIARELATHEREFANFCQQHEDTIIRISQAIHALRDVEFASTPGRTR